MDLRELIERGNEAAGSQKQLAELLGLAATFVGDAKRGRHGIPGFACVKLAHLIGEDPLTVIAASELVTEKKEERRAEWLPFLDEEWRRGRDSNPCAKFP